MKNKIKLVIFDLDGVLIDSKQNMKVSWNAARKKFNLKQKFKDYFQYVGLPFNKILDNLLIHKSVHAQIKNNYSRNSLKYIKKIRLYPDTLRTINKLKKNGIKIAIVTSKDKKRSFKIIKKFKIGIKKIICPEVGLKGKPFPDQLIKAIKMFKIDLKNIIYVGDMKVDYYAAKNARIGFVFAGYGYGKKFRIYRKSIANLGQLLKLL